MPLPSESELEKIVVEELRKRPGHLKGVEAGRYAAERVAHRVLDQLKPELGEEKLGA